MKIFKLLKLLSKGSKIQKKIKYQQYQHIPNTHSSPHMYGGSPVHALPNQGYPNQFIIGGGYNVSGIYPNGQHYQGICQVTQTHQQGATYYQFHWIINHGNQYSGIGQINGNSMIVNWGDATPIVYTIRENGLVLDGMYGNGSGRETLMRQ
jgi:hypothetical protein